MEPLTYITGAIAVSAVSLGIGKSLGNKNNVKNTTCKERQESCSALLIQKIDHLTEIVKSQKDGN